MAAPAVLREIPLLRLRLQHHHRFASGLLAPLRRSWCSTSATTLLEGDVSEKNTSASASSFREASKHSSWDDPNFRKWKDKEKEILRDVEPIISLTKEILHSDRYMDGEQLTAEDEKVVVEKLLAYHPNSVDKIGCGLDSIMVDRHPQFRQSRCLFVIRTDGVWIDFSYQKCLRSYIRQKYPAHAERFIRDHLKRGS